MNTREPTSRAPAGGFTLVELLIVIAIIAVLAGIVVTGFKYAFQQVEQTEAKQTVSNFRSAAEQVKLEDGIPPALGKKPDPERNDFPILWRKAVDRPNPFISGLEDSKIVVKDGDGYRLATREEELDPKVDKYYLDPWGMPYVYRCNENLKPEPWMIYPRGLDVYSWGPNKKDDSILGKEGDENDDVR